MMHSELWKIGQLKSIARVSGFYILWIWRLQNGNHSDEISGPVSGTYSQFYVEFYIRKDQVYL